MATPIKIYLPPLRRATSDQKPAITIAGITTPPDYRSQPSTRKTLRQHSKHHAIRPDASLIHHGRTAYAEKTVTYAEKTVTYAEKTVTYAEKTVTYAEKTVTYAEKTVTYAEKTVTYAEKTVTYAEVNDVYAKTTDAYA